MSCCLLKHRYTATYSRDTTTDICLRSCYTRRSHPATSPHTPSFRCPPYRQQATCQPVRKRATRGRLRSLTHPNLDAHETGRARSRCRDSRRGQPSVAGSGDETEDGVPYLQPFPPTKRVDSPVHAEKKTDQPPPDSGAFRRQLSPAPGERHQLPPPRSTGHRLCHLGSSRSTQRHPQSSQDRGSHAAPFNFSYAAAQAQRTLDDANQTLPRRRRFDEDIEQAKTAAQEASLAAKRAQQALAQSVASAAAGATAAPLPSSRPQVVASQRPRPGNDAFFKGIVACIASAPRVVVETRPRWWKRSAPSSRQRGRRRGKRTSSARAAWARVD